MGAARTQRTTLRTGPARELVILEAGGLRCDKVATVTFFGTEP